MLPRGAPLRDWGPSPGRGHPQVPTSVLHGMVGLRVSSCPAHLASAASAKPRRVRTGLDRGRVKVTAASRPAFLRRMFTRLEVGCGSARFRAGKALLRSREPVAEVTRAGFCTLRRYRSAGCAVAPVLIVFGASRRKPNATSVTEQGRRCNADTSATDPWPTLRGPHAGNTVDV